MFATDTGNDTGSGGSATLPDDAYPDWDDVGLHRTAETRVDWDQIPSATTVTGPDLAVSTGSSVPDLETVAPGPELGALLANIDVTQICGEDQVVVLRAVQRMVSHHTAQLYRAMAAIVDTYQEEQDEPVFVHAAHGASGEIQAALHVTRRSADYRLGAALELRQRLP